MHKKVTQKDFFFFFFYMFTQAMNLPTTFLQMYLKKKKSPSDLV